MAFYSNLSKHFTCTVIVRESILGRFSVCMFIISLLCALTPQLNLPRSVAAAQESKRSSRWKVTSSDICDTPWLAALIHAARVIMSHFNLIYSTVLISVRMASGDPAIHPATNLSSLEFDSAYWEQHLSDGMQKADLPTKLHLIFSLVIFLSVSVRQLLQFIFSSDFMKSRTELPGSWDTHQQLWIKTCDSHLQPTPSGHMPSVCYTI